MSFVKRYLLLVNGGEVSCWGTNLLGELAQSVEIVERPAVEMLDLASLFGLADLLRMLFLRAAAFCLTLTPFQGYEGRTIRPD